MRLKYFIFAGILSFMLMPGDIFSQVSDNGLDSIYLSLYTELIYKEMVNDAGEVTNIFDKEVNKAIIIFNGKTDFETIRSFEISLGTGSDLSDLLSYEFQLDNNLTLPEGLSFFRDNNLIILTLGQNKTPDRKYCRLKVKQMNGEYSQTISFP
jgi:hypothetical protein